MMRILLILFLGTLSSLLRAEATQMEGYASWYGGKFQGRLTASGEVFDTNLLTAAHPTFPFGTLVKVTNLSNDRSVIVRINDRGPFVPDRIIDLSKAAADAIGLTSLGVGKVKLEVVQEAKPVTYVTLQVGSFSSIANAHRLKNRLTEAGLSPSIEKTETGVHRVILEHVATEDLDAVKSKLTTLGFPHPIVRPKR